MAKKIVIAAFFGFVIGVVLMGMIYQNEEKMPTNTVGELALGVQEDELGTQLAQNEENEARKVQEIQKVQEVQSEVSITRDEISATKNEISAVQDETLENENLEDNGPPSALKLQLETEYYDELADVNAKLVLVDISEQHVWAFENGEVVMESPAVTGTKDRYDTQRGVYAVLIKSKNHTLRGSYGATKVKRWMRFNDRYSQGLHDASWRNEFGGEVYKNNGSHGCVNLPTDFALDLYDFVENGTPVIVQD